MKKKSIHPNTLSPDFTTYTFVRQSFGCLLNFFKESLKHDVQKKILLTYTGIDSYYE